VLTFLAGAELESRQFPHQGGKEACAVGLWGSSAVSGRGGGGSLCAGLDGAGELAGGVALSTTSVAVVYAVDARAGPEPDRFSGKRSWRRARQRPRHVDRAGLIFSPFTMRTLVFAALSIVVLLWCCRSRRPRSSAATAGGSRTGSEVHSPADCSEWRLAVWAGSEGRSARGTSLESYCGGTVGKDHVLVARLRTMTFGLLTAFYFIRAGRWCRWQPGGGGPSRVPVAVLCKMFSR